jgi:hypothetical protein
VTVRSNGQKKLLPELLSMNTDLAQRLHQLDRVHTYGSFYIADLASQSKLIQSDPCKWHDASTSVHLFC